ncbi:nucleotidyltransferase domain-containing protein [Candidatus Borrarchaeum sp.]|uniref:nucleotidyltransferase domain-containing protein n=1 Tax=Candidatus Borrarchaeum sp. TaxID=2846742 RepID=UPI00257C14A7|nr:nucleotidyltransferase domain-containing protein [Candidatus Borrarchaeum sp.]
MLYLYEKEIIDLLKKILKNNEESIDLAIIYGSFATGNYRPDSDLDLLIVGDNNKRDALQNELSEIYLKYSVPVSLVFLSKEEYRHKKGDPIIKNILKEGIRLSITLQKNRGLVP